jgi:acyl-CoA synthetase (AMP-forming)/AMP-acid ligase II
MSPATPASIADLLWRRACETPDRRAYLFLDDRGKEQEERTYAELARRAQAIGRSLRESARPGDRAALLFNPGMPFLDAFFGCLYAGILPVPMMPPRPNRERQATFAILNDCQPRFVLTTRSLMEPLRQRLGAAGTLDPVPACVAVDEIASPPEADAGMPPMHRAGADDIAFLQYTSGSTSTPKGVMVSHGNVHANHLMITAMMRQDENSTFVGWTPLYHDQGLIGNVLQPLHLGAPAVLMAPNAFLQRPHLWIEAVDRYRAHTSGGPDYAFALVADRVDPDAYRSLDLSCWKVAFNGAEPIRPGILERFARALAPLGFRAEAIYPCYGLAEATLFSTGAAAGGGTVVRSFDRAALEQGTLREAPDGARMPSCGRASPGLALTIVDPQTRAPLGEGLVGEVWLAGPSVAKGYWRRPEETAETFGARTADGTGPFLRTGDLGAMADGELYVCGRLKDMIIVRGRNIYPQDLEATARAAHPAVLNGNAATVAVMIGGMQRLLLAIEIVRTARHNGNAAEIAAAIRRAIRDEHDVMIDRVALTLPGGVPKTSSGKVRRREVARAFQDGTLPLWREDAEPPPVMSG